MKKSSNLNFFQVKTKYFQICQQPDPPTGLSYESIYSTRFVLSWDVVSGLWYNLVVLNGNATINSCTGGIRVTSPVSIKFCLFYD